MTKFFLLVLFFLPGNQPSNMIDWKADRKLTWKDFEAKPLAQTDNAALTSSNINFQFGYGPNGFRYSITCRFDKSRSWVKIKTDHILAHEQGHFDIAEIHARKLKKALSEYKYNESTVKVEINKIYQELMKQHHEMQSLYDNQTDHSRNNEKQAEWEKKIADALSSSVAYADYK